MNASFDGAVSSLVGIVAAAAGAGTEVVVGPPRAASGRPGIDVWLLGYGLGHRQRDRRVAHRHGHLDLLVSFAGPPDVMAARIHDVVQAIDTSPGHELVEDGFPIDGWTPFGVEPRPTLRVATPVVVELQVPVGGIVTEPLMIDARAHRGVVFSSL